MGGDNVKGVELMLKVLELTDFERYWLEGLDCDMLVSLEYGFTKWKDENGNIVWLYSRYDYENEGFLYGWMAESEKEMIFEIMEILQSEDGVLSYTGNGTIEEFMRNESICGAMTAIQDYCGWFFYELKWSNYAIDMLKEVILNECN